MSGDDRHQDALFSWLRGVSDPSVTPAVACTECVRAREACAIGRPEARRRVTDAHRLLCDQQKRAESLIGLEHSHMLSVFPPGGRSKSPTWIKLPIGVTNS